MTPKVPPLFPRVVTIKITCAPANTKRCASLAFIAASNPNKSLRLLEGRGPSHRQRQGHRAVVAALDLAVDVRPGDLLRQPPGDDEVVDAPPGVVLPGVEAVAPPAVGPGLVRVEVAEGVHEPRLQQLRHLPPLLVGEPGVAPVGPRIL